MRSHILRSFCLTFTLFAATRAHARSLAQVHADQQTYRGQISHLSKTLTDTQALNVDGKQDAYIETLKQQLQTAEANLARVKQEERDVAAFRRALVDTEHKAKMDMYDRSIKDMRSRREEVSKRMQQDAQERQRMLDEQSRNLKKLSSQIDALEKNPKGQSSKVKKIKQKGLEHAKPSIGKAAPNQAVAVARAAVTPKVYEAFHPKTKQLITSVGGLKGISKADFAKKGASNQALNRLIEGLERKLKGVSKADAALIRKDLNALKKARSTKRMGRVRKP